jgi:acetyl-CoA carboxylase carboxyl transferase subunit beta
MSWFRKKDNRIESVPAEERRVKTEGLFEKCPSCDAALYKRELEESSQVCPHCSHHFRIGARQRLALLYDEGKYEELDSEVVSGDPLNFTDTKPYKERLEQARRKTGLPEAVINARGTMGGHAVLVSAMDFQFLGGSMGVAVGEKITRTIERALREQAAVVVVSMSGGARMQEGTLSLMQMAKISAALARLDAARLPFISVLTDPTTGGVTASFAMLGDINIAEPKALIGFAGPRVIEQTIRQKPRGARLHHQRARLHVQPLAPRAGLQGRAARRERLASRRSSRNGSARRRGFEAPRAKPRAQQAV